MTTPAYPTTFRSWALGPRLLCVPERISGNPERELRKNRRADGKGGLIDVEILRMKPPRTSTKGHDSKAEHRAWNVRGHIRKVGMLYGKAGVRNIHLGNGSYGLQMLRDIVATTEIPYSQFLPTLINHNEQLFEEGIEYAMAGGFIEPPGIFWTVS